MRLSSYRTAPPRMGVSWHTAFRKCNGRQQGLMLAREQEAGLEQKSEDEIKAMIDELA